MLTASGAYLWGLILLIMIKVSELRVGNLVLYKQDNDELPVLKIDGDSKTVCLDLLLGLNMEVSEQDMDSIPLTPERLERAGMRYSKQFESYSTDYELLFCNEGANYWLCEQGNGKIQRIGKPFQNLHQLQNLYFALTSEELIINLP
jgi:hypothetical protein